jgi:hypothetical protein
MNLINVLRKKYGDNCEIPISSGVMDPNWRLTINRGKLEIDNKDVDKTPHRPFFFPQLLGSSSLFSLHLTGKTDPLISFYRLFLIDQQAIFITRNVHLDCERLPSHSEYLCKCTIRSIVDEKYHKFDFYIK